MTGVKATEPTSSDEAGEINAADNPAVVREDARNTSTSSGLRADDEAKGEKIKEQLRRGSRETSPLD